VEQGQVSLQHFQDRILPEAAALAKQEADTFTPSQHCKDMVNGFNHFLQTTATVGYNTTDGTAIIGNWFEKYGIQNLTHVQNYLTWERNQGAKTLLLEIRDLAKTQLAAENIHPPAPDAPAELGAAYVKQLEAKKAKLLKAPPAPLFKPTEEGYQALLQELLAKPGHDKMKEYLELNETLMETGLVPPLAQLLHANKDAKVETIESTLYGLLGQTKENTTPELQETFTHFSNSIQDSLSKHSRNRVEDLENARTFIRMQAELTQLRQAFKQHVGEQHGLYQHTNGEEGSRIITTAPPPFNPNFAFTSNLKPQLIETQRLQPNSPLHLPVGTSLAYTNLSNTNLANAQLVGANFTGSNLSGTNLNGANLTSANLNNVNLTDSHIAGTIFGNAQLSRANLSGAEGFAPNFAHARLDGANLQQATLPKANFTNAHLEGADATLAQLQNTVFTQAKLTEGNFSGANLANAQLDDLYSTGKTQFIGANLTDANLSRSEFNNGVDFASATLNNANLSNSKFGNSDVNVGTNFMAARNNWGLHEGSEALKQLEQLEANGINTHLPASLMGANLQGAEIQHTDLVGVDLSRANLANSKVKYSDLSNANLEKAILYDINLYGNNMMHTNLDQITVNGESWFRKNDFTNALFSPDGQDPRNLSKVLSFRNIEDNTDNSLANNRTVILPEDPKVIEQREAAATEQQNKKNKGFFNGLFNRGN
jgi:uncharacterized protein YjbI with pentapeptide repeats